MKLNYRKVVALALFALALSSVSMAQSFEHKLRADIPFSFYAGGKLLPAGRYFMTFNMNTRSVALIQNVRGDGSFLSGSLEDGKTNAPAVLTFRANNEDVFVLENVQAPDFGLKFKSGKAAFATSVERTSGTTEAVVMAEGQ
jgi:hypothetical protein